MNIPKQLQGKEVKRFNNLDIAGMTPDKPTGEEFNRERLYIQEDIKIFYNHSGECCKGIWR